MKQKIKILFAVIILAGATLVACKKSSTEADYTTELSAHADDQARFSAESDAISDDVNSSIDGFNSFNGRTDNITVAPCNATIVVDSISNPKKITITYNGANCQNTRTRTGVVVISMPLASKWKEAGAIATVTITNLKITRLSDNKSITINGSKTITNVSGGRLRDVLLGTTTSITHKIASSGINVTFDDGSIRSWQEEKQRVFTASNSLPIITTTGTHTEGTTTGVSEWGTNRFGNSFVTAITKPMVVRGDCSYRLVSGEVTHSKLIANVVTTFGLDANGNAVTACPTGSYYFKLVWTGINGATHTVIAPY